MENQRMLVRSSGLFSPAVCDSDGRFCRRSGTVFDNSAHLKDPSAQSKHDYLGIANQILKIIYVSDLNFYHPLLPQLDETLETALFSSFASDTSLRKSAKRRKGRLRRLFHCVRLSA
jgi:hypothetical protein